MLKQLILLTSAAAMLPASAQLDFRLVSRKALHFTSKKNSTYLAGDVSLVMGDGSWVLSGCPHPSPTRIFPSMPCPLGTTGFLARGDLNGDGVRDDGSFWSLAQAPTPAVVTAPFRSDGLRVESAPPSKFLRPGIVPVNDGGVVIWYDTLDPFNQQQYDIAAYSWIQGFAGTPAGRALHDETVVTGSYIFSIPWIHDERQRLTIGVNKVSMPEAYPGLTQSPLKRGFRFTNKFNSTGQIELDPRLFNDLEWDGNTPGVNVFAGADEFRLWMLRVPSVNPLALPGTDPTIIDPNMAFPIAGGAIYIPDPYITEYRLPALFFAVGDTVRAYLRLSRAHPTSSVAGDFSVRVFTADISFIDTYEGFATLGGGFPPGTLASERLPNGDFDGDGFSNLVEFALSSDVNDPASIPVTTPGDIGGQPGSFEVVPLGDGRCQVSVTKRPMVGESISYFIEHSEDMVTWTRIPLGGNAGWVEDVNDGTTLQVTSAAAIVPGVAPGCFFRVAVSQN